VTSLAERRFGRGAWPWIILVAAAFVVSTNHVLGRYVSGNIPPVGLAFWRVVVGALVLLPFAWRELIAKWPIIKSHWKLFLVMAFVFMPMGNAAIYLAYNFTTAINGAVIATAQPALTILLAWLVLNHTITRMQVLGLIIAALGVLVIIMRGDLTALTTLSVGGGDLLMLLAIAGFAIYTVLLRRVPPQIGPMLILIVVQMFGAATLAPFYLVESLTYLPVPLTVESLIVIGWVGIVIAVVAVGLGNMSVLALGPGKASIGNYLRALFAAGMATVLLGEALELYHLVAFALVIFGVLLMTLGPTPTPRVASREDGAD
jgi:drug/metabolite transporter (DMT)-like permease